MQSDINQTKSRSYNYFLRNFHIGLRILIALITSGSFDQYEQCYQLFNKFLLPLSITLIVLNLIFIIYFKLKPQFPRCQFFFFLSINIVLTSVIFLLNYTYFTYKSTCIKNQLLSSYIFLQIISHIFITLIILFTKFQYAQRYTNTPGNIIWTIMILRFSQYFYFTIILQILCYVNMTISISGFGLNILTLYTGITYNIKKYILTQWIVALILMTLTVLVSLILYLNNSYFSTQYSYQIVKNILLKFILISVLDLFFWIWGLLTLTYQNGDLIRSAILWSRSEGIASGYTNYSNIKGNSDKVDQSKQLDWWDISYRKQDTIKT